MFHPWRRLRALGGLLLVWERLGPGVLGATDGRSLVVLHPEQSQRQRRSTLTHELAHVELGHEGGCSPEQEGAARELAARWLVPMDQLVDGLRWTRHVEELAEELWVDVETLRDRIRVLDAEERELLRQLSLDVEHVP